MKVKAMFMVFPVLIYLRAGKVKDEILHNGKSGKTPVPQGQSESTLTVFGHLKLRKVKLEVKLFFKGVSSSFFGTELVIWQER